MNSVYVTANFPTNPSANMNDSTVTYNDNTYSTVGEYEYVQHSTYSTINHPSIHTTDPIYSTVNLPQQD